MNTPRPFGAHYFFHIPKTAGTTLISFLDTKFSPAEVCKPQLWSKLLSENKSDLTGYRLFRGHFYGYLRKYLGMPLHEFTFLRNPIERALSHYGHVIREPNHYFHERAKELGTLRAYMEDDLMGRTVSNFQARSLVLDLDPAHIAADMDPESMKNLELELCLETALPDMTDRDLLEEAKERLDQFDFVGITECFDHSLFFLCRSMGWSAPYEANPYNINPERPKSSQIDWRDMGRLVEMNWVDLELYEYALDLFESQCGSILEQNV